jgi:hypothetical protein
MNRFEFTHPSLINVATVVRLDATHWELRAVDIIGRVVFHGQLSCLAAAVAMGRLLERTHHLRDVEVYA